MLTITAAIGQGVLRSAIRLHDNYIRYDIADVIDEKASGCLSCINGSFSCACEHCTSKVLKSEQKKVYINEKNKYGYRQALSRNDILLFMYLHFLNPNQNGFLHLVDAEEAASFIGCHTKTIKNSLCRMEKAGYIAFQKAYGVPFHYNIFLKDYSKYFSKASENGRGYIRLSRDLFSDFVQNKTITALRLAIRSYLYTVDESLKHNGTVKRTYRELKRDLPNYCHKKQIREAISMPSFRKIFNIHDKKYTLDVMLKPEYDTAHTLVKLKSEFEPIVRNKIKLYNKKADKNHQFNLMPSDYEDIINIAQQFPTSLILSAIDEVIEDYIKTDIPIKKPGALIRSFTKRRAEFIA